MNKGYTRASCNKHACMHISYKKLSTPSLVVLPLSPERGDHKPSMTHLTLIIP